MNYVGIDYHKQYSHVTAVNKEGDILRSQRLANDVPSLQAFFAELDGPSQVVLEASRTWGTLYELLVGLDGVAGVTLAHAQKVRAIAEAQIKTDKIDADTLAQLLRANLIPAAYIPSAATRTAKELVRQRVFLVRLRTRVKNRLHVLLDRRQVPRPAVTDLFGKRGLAYLKALAWEGVEGEILREQLVLLETLNTLVKEAERELTRLLGADPRVQRLRTVPGLGPILAAVVALEIDDITRFRHPAKLAAYAGLVPTTSASGGRTYHGHLLPSSNKWLRWAFVEAAWVALRHSPYCRTVFETIKRRKGPHTAAIALARRLNEIVWHVLTEQRAYEERPVHRPRAARAHTALSAALTTA